MNKSFSLLQRRQNPRPSKVGSNTMAAFGLLNLRGFWPGSSLDELGMAYDISGQARHLTPDSAPTGYLYNDKIPFINYNGSQYHYRLDEAGLQITGDLTMGFWCNVAVPADSPALMVKDNGTQRCYGIDVTSSQFRFYVYAPGLTAVNNPTTIIGHNYYFVVGRFTSGEKVDIFVNGVWTTSATANTTITNAATDFYVASRNGGDYLTGRVAWAFISAAAASDTQIRQMYDSAKSSFRVYE